METKAETVAAPTKSAGISLNDFLSNSKVVRTGSAYLVKGFSRYIQTTAHNGKLKPEKEWETIFNSWKKGA